MFTSTEKVILLSGSIFGSIFLFSTSLNSSNDIILRRMSHTSVVPNEGNLSKLIMINGITMLFSGFTFGYLAYTATK